MPKQTNTTDKTTITIRLEQKLFKELEAFARAEEMNRTEAIKVLLERGLRSKEELPASKEEVRMLKEQMELNTKAIILTIKENPVITQNLMEKESRQKIRLSNKIKAFLTGEK